MLKSSSVMASFLLAPPARRPAARTSAPLPTTSLLVARSGGMIAWCCLVALSPCFPEKRLAD